MEIIRDKVKIEYFDYALLNEYFSGMKHCVFDIETLGLNSSVSPAVLFGFLEPATDGTAEIVQYFLNDIPEERDALELIADKLNEYDYIITYNGKHFDIPYVERRYRLLHHSELKLRPYNLDLYLILYGHSALKDKLTGLKQKNIERYMGMGGDRDDEISGKESVELYYHYLLEENPVIKEKVKSEILLHNHDDVLQLYKILPVIKQADIHKAINKLGFPVRMSSGSSGSGSASSCLSMFSGGSLTLLGGDNVFANDVNLPDMNVAEIKLNSKQLLISGKYLGDSESYVGYSSFERPYEVVLTPDNRFEVKIPVQKEKSSVFVNLNDYFCDSSIFSGYGGYVNDYLILSENGNTNYRELNAFAKQLLLTAKKAAAY